MDNKEQFAELMGRLSIAFGVPISAARTAIYWESLKAYSIDRLRVAVDEATHIFTPRWKEDLPSVAELIKLMPVPSTVPLLTESLSERDSVYGQWQCRFVVWLMGYRHTGMRKVRTRHGHTEKKRYKKGVSRISEAENPVVRSKLWHEFLKEHNAPEWLHEEGT